MDINPIELDNFAGNFQLHVLENLDPDLNNIYDDIFEPVAQDIELDPDLNNIYDDIFEMDNFVRINPM